MITLDKRKIQSVISIGEYESENEREQYFELSGDSWWSLFCGYFRRKEFSDKRNFAVLKQHFQVGKQRVCVLIQPTLNIISHLKKDNKNIIKSIN
jgi:hypothetical protein